jgi:tetratricopeptide (TPR) repeat protein
MEPSYHSKSSSSLISKLRSTSKLSPADRSKLYLYTKSLNKYTLSTLQSSSTSKLKEVYNNLLLAEEIGLSLLRSSTSQEEYKRASKLLSFTYATLGCYFDTRGKVITALEYTDKALKIQAQAQLGARQIAHTLMNLAKILSKLERHDEALKYLEEGIVVLEKEDEVSEGSKVPHDLAAAYYTYAIELEILKRLQEARTFYTKAYNTATEILGETHELTKEILYKLRSIDNKSLTTSRGTSSDSSLDSGRLSNTIVLHHTHKILNHTNYKLIILDKSHTQSIKILAFPPSNSPISRLNLLYNSLSSIFSIPISGSITSSLSKEDLISCMDLLVDLLYIENSKLKLTSNPVHIFHPEGSKTLHRISAEREGARYSVVIGSRDERKVRKRESRKGVKEL